MTTKILKPRVPGTLVRDPLTQQRLPDEGVEVRMTSFWIRRLAAGDVVVVEPGRVDTRSDTVVPLKPIPDSRFPGEEQTP